MLLPFWDFLSFIYIYTYILAVIPVLRTGHLYFLLTVNQLFQSLCLALLSHAMAVPVCICVTHHLPFIGSGIYYLSFLTFPLDARLDSRRELRWQDPRYSADVKGLLESVLTV